MSSGPPNAKVSRYAARYELIGLLGVGGMGSVYRVRDLDLDEEVALKILRKDLAQTAAAVARFRREVKLARRVTHKNVARVFDVGEHDGEHFFTMECIEGEPLSTLLSPGKPFPIPQALDIATQIASGLAAAHDAAVVHRDLKPENVIVAKDGRVVITDFGVAVARAEIEPALLPGRGAGTPLYMSPEQIEGRQLDERTDLYGLGLLLYEMTTGTAPWGRERDTSSRLARLAVPPPDPRERNATIPEGLAHLVLSLLEREPQSRPRSAAAVVKALSSTQAVVTTRPPEATATGSSPKPSPRPAIATTGTAHAMAVAVLPIRNLGRPEDAYLAETVTDELIDRLATTPGLRVASRVALRLREHGGDDLRDFGRRLGVDVMVEGSLVKRAGGVLRVTARLVEVERGFVLWTGRFDRPASEIFELVPEVAKAIARTLTIELAAPRGRGPMDPKNVDVFVRAKQAYGDFTLAGATTAAELLGTALSQAIDDDPLLHSYLALAELRTWSLDPATPPSLPAQAEQRARRALLLEPTLAEAHLALGVHAMLAGDAPVAARRFEEAVRCNPALGEAHDHLGRLRCESGNVVQGLRDLDIALRLDPRLLTALWSGARALELSGDPVGADERLAQADAIAPGHAVTLTLRARLAHWRRDKRAIARVRDEAAATLSRGGVDELLLRAFVDPQPEGAIGALTAQMATRGASASQRAQVMQILGEQRAIAGELDEALSALKAAAASSIDTLWFERCPVLARVRGNTAFGLLRAQVASRAASVFPAGKKR